VILTTTGLPKTEASLIFLKVLFQW